MAELSDHSKKARLILQNPNRSMADIHAEVTGKKKEVAKKMKPRNFEPYFSKADIRGQKKVSDFNSKFMERSQRAADRNK